MRKRAFLLTFIILFAFILRLYQLGQTPLGLEWDEVALGYDAYSVLRTGKDQFGNLLPLTFRSIDDYKPPIYEYITVPTVFLFSLNAFSVRLPSALFGVLSVIATFWLAYSLFSKVTHLERYSYTLALTASFLMSLSPWHLQFSRAAFEVNISVLITILAVASFLTGLNNKKFFLISAVFFGLNFFSYHSTRVVSPLLMISLFTLFHKSLPSKRHIFYFFTIWGIFFLAFLPILFSKDAQIRFSATNIFKPGARYLDDEDLEKKFLDMRQADTQVGFELAGKIFHNQRLIYTDYNTLKKAFNNYISHFNFEYLFMKGDAPLHHAPGFGLLYVTELPFIIIGIIYILKKSLNRYTVILLLWLLLVPIPSAVTKGAPHAVRTELFLPSFQILAAIGLTLFTIFIKKEAKYFFYTGIMLISISFSINTSFYMHQYYIHTNYELSGNWMYSRKEAVEETVKLKNNYDKVIISPRIEVPLVFWLFYTKYPPEKYLAEGGTISGGFADERNHFDKYEFKYFDYDKLPKDKKILLVGTNNILPNDFPGGANIIKTIYNLNGTQALLLAENRH